MQVGLLPAVLEEVAGATLSQAQLSKMCRESGVNSIEK